MTAAVTSIRGTEGLIGRVFSRHALSVKTTVLATTELLTIFWLEHDPTQLNRQGPDYGSQYRSSIFYSNETQQKIALAYIAQLDAAHVYPNKIVTRVDSLPGFFPAEKYHQDYLVHNPHQPYIEINDLPKIAHLKQVLPQMYADRPVLVAAN